MTSKMTREERLALKHNGMELEFLFSHGDTLRDDVLAAIAFGQAVGSFNEEMPVMFTRAMVDELIQREADRHEAGHA